MDIYSDYKIWTNLVLADQHEFAHRYILDIYYFLRRPSNRNFYYSCTIDSAGKLTIADKAEQRALILPSDKDRQAYVDYLYDRFASSSRDLEAWHDRQENYLREDRTNWV